ncbi:uncharacterized protein CANTADRAFT_7494 [Suhomyces tanzawaensis NRRL Y-17324]|uniref:UBX domain-containing protein n=1 Tax=Suhomyces tanzawaensis NRRL Y-17324 TaxID=984487 RepID=A0A1E4SEX0_9ASCO|nr:uncharacterized protein CANTADRAFT_7494 [Suhomyces tanzawaensis NRRL Y-17324]ODV78030.1 hypothetical protein CANTADRAFT_7494 [Suhomyces tanzawaensis NRRL Y-17324]
MSVIEQFKAITGLEGDEHDELASRLLSIHNNDLNNALSQYFDSGFDAIDLQSPPDNSGVNEAPTAFTSGVEAHETEDIHRRHSEVVNLQSQMFMDALMPRLPKAPRISSSWHLEVGIHASLNDREKLVELALVDDDKGAQRPVWRLLWFLLIVPKALLQILYSAVKQLLGFNGLPRITDPNRFPRTFDYAKYDPVSPPPVALDSYNVLSNFNDSYDQAQKTYVWLLVVLCNDSDESQQFVANLVENPQFHSLFNKTDGTYKETLIHVANASYSREAHEIGLTYKAKKLPYIMLVGNVSSNPQTVLSSMSILYKSNLPGHFITPENSTSTGNKILRSISGLLESYNPQLVSSRFDQQEMEFARLIKQQQDDAYVQSLERDRLKKIQKQQEADQTLAAENAVNIRRAYLDKLRGHNLTNPENATVTSRIAIKLPNGKRLVEIVDKSLTVNQLYLHVELQLFLLDEDPVDDVSEELVVIAEELTREEYYKAYPFKFELVQPFPKKVIPSGNSTVGESKELSSGGNLLVEFLDEDDEDDEE